MMQIVERDLAEGAASVLSASAIVTLRNSNSSSTYSTGIAKEYRGHQMEKIL